MKPITDINELRQIQLSIMDNVHEFCVRQGIKYSLGGGTLIGAFRHQGYIPWDDDIDIYLLRADYERLIREYSDPSGRFRLIGPHNAKPYFYTFSKVVDTRTVMYEDEVEDYDIGVYVDVFPLDYVPDSLWWRRRVFWLKHLLYKIRRCKMSHGQYLRSTTANFFYRNLPLSVGTVDWLLHRYVHRRRPSGFLCEMCETERPLRGCYSVEAFAETMDVPFEGRSYKSMTGYDEYLSNTYGNYMQIPPKEQQTQHQFKAYWK